MTQATTGRNLEFADFQRAVDAEESTRSLTTYASKISKTFKRVQAGAYQITYNAQIYCKTADTQWCQVKLDVNGTTVCRDRCDVGETVAKQSNGIIYRTYSAGDQPSVSLDFRRQGGTGEVGIRRANIGLVKVDET